MICSRNLRPGLTTPIAALAVLAAALAVSLAAERSKPQLRASIDDTTNRVTGQTKIEALAAVDNYVRNHPVRGGRLSPRLRVLRDVVERQGISAARRVASLLGIHMLGDRVWVLVRPVPSKALPPRAYLERMGLAVKFVDAESGEAYVLLPVSEVGSLGRNEAVLAMRVPRGMQTHGVISEGVEATAADLWQQFDPPAGLPLNRPARLASVTPCRRQ